MTNSGESLASGDLFPGFWRDGFGGGEGVEEGLVLLLGEGAVDVVCGAFVVAGGEVDAIHVDGGGVDDGGDGVVEGEVAGTGEALEFRGEGGAGEWAGGEDGDGVGIVPCIIAASKGGDFFAVDGDEGLGGDAGGDALGEEFAVYGEGVAGGDGGGVGVGEEEGTCEAHLLLEEPGGGVFGLRLEGVGADELGEVGGLVGLGGADGAHFVEVYVATRGGGLEGGFWAGEASADYFNSLHTLILFG